MSKKALRTFCVGARLGPDGSESRAISGGLVFLNLQRRSRLAVFVYLLDPSLFLSGYKTSEYDTDLELMANPGVRSASRRQPETYASELTLYLIVSY